MLSTLAGVEAKGSDQVCIGLIAISNSHPTCVFYLWFLGKIAQYLGKDASGGFATFRQHRLHHRQEVVKCFPCVALRQVIPHHSIGCGNPHHCVSPHNQIQGSDVLKKTQNMARTVSLVFLKKHMVVISQNEGPSKSETVDIRYQSQMLPDFLSCFHLGFHTCQKNNHGIFSERPSLTNFSIGKSWGVPKQGSSSRWLELGGTPKIGVPKPPKWMV